MLARLRSGILHPRASGSAGVAGVSSSKEGRDEAGSSDEDKEIFDEPLHPNYMLQTQEEKQPQGGVAANAIGGARGGGQSPQLSRRDASGPGLSPSPHVARPSVHSLDSSTASARYEGESSLDAPNMSRSKTLPVGQASPGAVRKASAGGSGVSGHHQSQGSASSGQVLPEDSSPASGMKKGKRDLRTLPPGAPSEAPRLANRGGVNDDYVDPFDARLRSAMGQSNTSPPISRPKTSNSSNSSAYRAGPSDTYQDPFDARFSSSSGGARPPYSARSPSDTYEDPFDARRPGQSAGDKRSPPPSGSQDSDSLYNEPLDARHSQAGDTDDYMNPYDARSSAGRKLSPIPTRKVPRPSPSRLMDVSKLPPTSSDSGNYCQPYDMMKNGHAGGAGSSRPPTSQQLRQAAHQADHHSSRPISVPEVLVDENADPEGTEGTYVLPRDNLVLHGRGPGSSPAVHRSTSSERGGSESLDAGSRPGSTSVSRSSSGRSLPPSDSEGVSVDVQMPLDSQPWYHGALRREDAERRLAGARDGSFIIRQSESCLTDFSMSLRNHHETMHLKIHQRPKDKRYVLGLNSRPFKSIQEMVLYYTKNNLPIRGAEHICLMNGVGRASAIYANVQF